MRVAVYLPEGHPEVGVDPETGAPAEVRPFAYRLGRIEEGVHNAPIGHAAVPYKSFVGNLLSEARSEYPDAEVRLEVLIDNGDGTSRWLPFDQYNPDAHVKQGAGNVKARELHVTNEQDAGGAPADQTGADA